MKQNSAFHAVNVYDATGNRLQQTDARGITTSSIQGNYSTIDYSYDPTGNRISKAVPPD